MTAAISSAVLEKRPKRGGGVVPSHSKASVLSRVSWSGLQHGVKTAYQKTFVELIRRRKSLVHSDSGRQIPLSIEHPEPLIDMRRGHEYISNDIRTSRYTLWDFVPKQLFFQFTRIGNFYFLCVGIPQMVSIFLASRCRYFGADAATELPITACGANTNHRLDPWPVYHRNIHHYPAALILRTHNDCQRGL